MARVQATTSLQTSFAFECRCGYVGRARVSAEGYAEADGARKDALEHDALERAEGAAWNDALTTVELAPCPRCGARDRSRWLAWLRAQSVGALAWGVVAALVCGAATFLLHQRLDRAPLAVAAASGLVVAMLVLTVRARHKTRRGDTLGFDPPR